ncbi:YqzK family protein [Shouchella patagoniensis]|uniref:YqzK family protein n=1 Tax=Shouchella patagoniensis TaxID=228576 RepID=UPI000995C3DB|nr:YqzK family protein [Shouchella patagoniensis]
MVRTMAQTIKAALLFVGCTIFFYYGILWVNEEISQHQKYDEPEGRAIKASTGDSEFNSISIEQRLELFLWSGE